MMVKKILKLKLFPKRKKIKIKNFLPFKLKAKLSLKAFVFFLLY